MLRRRRGLRGLEVQREALLLQQRHALVDQGVRGEDVLDLAQLDAEAVHLDLVVEGEAWERREGEA
jgi:hypothetical protein